MKITSDLFEAFLKCPTKCWLRASGELDSGNTYAEWVKSQTASYRTIQAEKLLSETPKNDCIVSPPPENLKNGKWRLAVNVLAQTPETRPCRSRGAGDRTSTLGTSQDRPASAAVNEQTQPNWTAESWLHAVEHVPPEGRGKPAQFIPIRFIYRNKHTKDDKLLLAFDAFVISEMFGRTVSLGKIIHGDDHAVLKVKISALAGEVRKRLGKIAALLASPTLPDLVLNRHCAECEFQAPCRKLAIEKDDLSLLAGMSAKERQKLRSKGIFTVTQLSYTFRPRRRPKRQREKYHHSLKALAIREQKIHIVGSPELKIEGTPIYLDVEGLPDCDFYYLIGVRVGNGNSAVQHSLWADTLTDEGKIWREFLAILTTVEKPVLIHYGSYETTFLKEMIERHGKPKDESVAAKAFCSAINIVSIMFAHTYFPTFSNSLKEIAGYLNFKWSEAAASGTDSIVWRQNWEKLNADVLKHKLTTYNAEDCKALDIVSSKLIELQSSSTGDKNSVLDGVVDTTKLKRVHPYGFKRNNFVLPELDGINSAAYWDYQRDRVFVKSKVVSKRNSSRASRPRNIPAPNKTIECSRPHECPQCGSSDFYKHTKYTKTLIDLKFMRYGVKRWITCYRFHRYECQNCRTIFQPIETYWGKNKFGSEIIAYAVYLVIELRLPQIHVASKFNRMFGFDFDSANIGRFKADAAEKYKEGYNSLVNRLCTGRLLHIDETKINLRPAEGFVWVFANMEEVAYIYRETRV